MDTLIIALVIGTLLIAIGFLSARYPKVISGYKEVNDRDGKILRRIKCVMIIAGIVTILGCVLAYLLDLHALYMICLIGPALLTPLFYMGKPSKNKKSFIGFGLIFVVIIAFSLYSSKESDIKIENRILQIEGLYSESIPLNDIKSVELMDTIPAITLKTNGYALGSTKKGYFMMKGMGKVKLFLHSKDAPFVKIDTGEKTIIFNSKKTDDTKSFYQILTNITK